MYVLQALRFCCGYLVDRHERHRLNVDRLERGGLERSRALSWQLRSFPTCSRRFISRWGTPPPRYLLSRWGGTPSVKLWGGTSLTVPLAQQ